MHIPTAWPSQPASSWNRIGRPGIEGAAIHNGSSPPERSGSIGPAGVVSFSEPTRPNGPSRDSSPAVRPSTKSDWPRGVSVRLRRAEGIPLRLPNHSIRFTRRQRKFADRPLISGAHDGGAWSVVLDQLRVPMASENATSGPVPSQPINPRTWRMRSRIHEAAKRVLDLKEAARGRRPEFDLRGSGCPADRTRTGRPRGAASPS